MIDKEPAPIDGASPSDQHKLPPMQQQPDPFADHDDVPEGTSTTPSTPTPEEGSKHADKVWNG